MLKWLMGAGAVLGVAAVLFFHVDSAPAARDVVVAPAMVSIPQWSARVDLPVWVSTSGPGELVEILMDNPEDRDDDYFRERYAGAIAFITENQEALQNIMIPALHEFRVKLRKEFAEFYGTHRYEPAVLLASYIGQGAEEARQPVTEADTKAQLTMDYIFLFNRRKDGHVYTGYRFSWDQDPEHGVGVLMCGDRVVEVDLDAGWRVGEEEGGEVF